MTQPYPYIIQGNNITVVIGSTPFTVSKTHITYPQVLEAIKAGDWDRVKEIIDPVKVVLSFGQGNVSIEGEQLFWKGKVLHSALSTRMIAMLQEGFDITPLANFMENLYRNPSKRSVDELYSFLEKNNLPITPCGSFLAYKKVRADYLDIHSGTMDNSVGQVVEMERNQVDDDKDRTCSAGLHFCSQKYLPSFGSACGNRVVIVKINPADVVSIPSDYNNAKGRACRYEVVGEIDNTGDKIDSAFNQPVQSNANGNVAAPVVPVAPKTGSSDFYRGYTDGYEGNTYAPSAVWKDRVKYDEGYEKGRDASEFGDPPRYQYVPTPEGWTRHADGKISPPPGTVITAQTETWPFPSVNR